MKVVKSIKVILLVAICCLLFSIGVFAQDDKNDKKPEIAKLETNDGSQTPTETEDDLDAKQTETLYTNYLSEYRLGPNDTISVEVFGQCPDYCKMSINVPPTAKISYPLIREGVTVGGKTTLEVQDEITKKLEEFIIDPQVTVTLDKAGSALYSVVGKVGTPGPRIMDRQININEAIIMAGGLSKEADKDKVFIARINPQGYYEQHQVDLKAIERGKSPTIVLRPRDQVIVGSKGFTWNKFFDYLGKASAARILFGSPF